MSMRIPEFGIGNSRGTLPGAGSRPRLAPRSGGRGFTLVELMVAMVLGLVVVGGALLVYMTSSASYRTQEATAQMIENGRTAVELISRDLRMAEYWKCIGWEPGNLSNHLPYDQRGIYSTNGADGDPDAPDTLRTTQAMDGTSVTVTAQVTLFDSDTSTSNPIEVSDASGFTANDIIVINDCAKGDVFRISSVNGNELHHNCTTCGETYGIGSVVMRVEDTLYTIADNTRGQPSLYRSVNGGAPEELLEGVEDLQFFFGEDTDSDGVANRYVTAEVINAPCADGSNEYCWLRVPSVRISLLLRTIEDDLTLEPQTYNYNGATVTAADGRLRRAFTAVVALRNNFNNQ